MSKITKIVIKGCSGYGPADLAYEDKLIITEDRIGYEYRPLIQSDLNPLRKWSYKTNSPMFKAGFNAVCALMPDILNPKSVCECTDVGMIDFTATYTDKSKKHIRYWCTGEAFSDCFSILQGFTPPGEIVPEVLR